MTTRFGGIQHSWNVSVGSTSTGGLHGYVVIHDYSPDKVSVSVFAETGARQIHNPTSWRQAYVTISKDDKEIARRG